MDGTHIEAPERIAVVGISGRFPKSADLDEFWMNLRDGVECISFENEHDAYDGLDTTGESMFVPAGGVLDGIDLFDAPFFGINARDAETMDPQQRLFLECAWHSLEAAGYNPETYPGLVGVFAGAAQSFYMSDLYANADALASLDDFQIGIGNDKDHLTTQVAYRLNLRGPSVTVQTACSTSLVAVCVACQSLLSYQCDLALAGGVAVDSKTSEGYTYQPGGILSPDGRCRVFDAAAQGTVPGNGVGIVVLKRLSEALGDRDHICAVISGFALNNDGFRKVGYTAPSVTGQAEAVALAHAVAGVDPETISYIEAHGTGTSLGDPIEIAALDQVFCAGTSKRGFCAIGSVKSNIGHLDTAAGVAGLIKAVLALQHEAIPPTLHFVEPNPEIDFANSAFRVNTELVEWPRTDRPRRAGVSSFGIGGTNAHVVLEEAPQVVSSGRSRAASLLTISARTAGALETATDELANHLERHPGLGLENAAYTCHVGRKAFDCRRALVCDDAADAAAALAGRDPRRLQTRTVDANDAPPVCFLFPGQGTQELDMGLDLYREEPGFRGPVDRCSELLEPLLGLDLRRLLYPDDERRAQAEAELGRTAYTQPALFVVEYALARLWIDWGIEPVAMIGHSIGEYVAACVSGVLGLEDALELVAARGRLMDEMPSGAMLAVALSEAAAERHLDGGLSLAAVNGVASCVLSGPTEDVDRVAGELEAAGIRNQRLATSHAFHSEMMDPAVEAFLSIASRVALGAPRIPYISNVTGTWISPDEAADPGYWGRQLRRTVRFADGLHELYRSRTPILLEVGPGRTLGNLARQQPDAASRRPIIASLPPRGGGSSDLESLLGALGDLWLHGVEPDWERFHAGEQCHRVPLPLYPFERQSYWIGPAADEWTDAEEETARRDEAPERFAYPVWVPAPPSRQADHSGRTRPRWFVFADESDLSRYVIQGLGDGGAEIVTVAAGDSYACRDDASFAVGQDPEDYVRLLEAAGAPDAIAHLWNAARPDEETPLPAHLEAGFLSVVHLAQALERLGLDTPLELTVVTNGVDFVIGNEAICPARATVIAPCTVLPQEYPHISCRLLDIDAGDEPAAGSVVDELTREPFEPHVAHRNGRRWLRAFDPAWLEAPEELPRRTRDGGVYLVTGGLGRIATVLGAFIARTTADVTLVLTGRSELPPESAWDVCLENEPTSITAARIRNLLHLRASGAEVMYASADAADAAQMSHVIEEAESRFGPINGVVHAAGDTESYSPVNELDRADVDRQLRAKLGGAVVLDSLLGDRDLDFCVLLSSLSALVGGVGLVAYAAANCFLDALAAKRNQEGRVPWISIDWGAWHFPTEDEPADAEALWQANAILPADGESAFDAILTRAPRQVVVSRTSVAALYDEVVRADVPDDELELGSTRTVHDRPVLSTPYVAPRSDDEEQQAAIWAELLGIGPIGVFDNFFDLGGHSLLAIQLISRVRRAFGVEVPVSLVFDSPTIADLVASVDHARNGTDARVAGVLDLVEGLSDSEVRVLLAQEGAR